jgi:GntR family transcriptional regulator
MQTVDRLSPIPYYRQLAELLRREITERPAEHGAAALPSENELTERYRVSRATVRSALSLLERERIIYREKGKGSFAAARRVEHDLTELVSTTEDMRRRGWPLLTRVLSLDLVDPLPHVAAALELPDGGNVYRLVRLRVVQDEPLSLQTNFLPAHLLPNLEQHDLSSSLYRLCESVYGLRLWTGRQVLRSRGATAAEARLLQVRRGAPVMSAERITFAANGKAVEYLDAVWRGDRYEFTVRVGCRGSGAAERERQ